MYQVITDICYFMQQFVDVIDYVDYKNTSISI